MTVPSIRQQLQRHSVALLSLVIAVSGLLYNTWRNETSEAQRNQRAAAFRILESLGELQETVNYQAYFSDEVADMRGRVWIDGFGNAATVRDLSGLLPASPGVDGERLFSLWQQHVPALDQRQPNGRGRTEAAITAEQILTAAITDTREATLRVIEELN